ncbi:uncharacterized protein B0I36DRAFT_385724 [Microdochium trichocladiopsis]|uniref:Inner kinetochore subunit AME1 domain-containing protein n=1 Tax=Microdochium trichocladiopsis TaxID=1682393 RepID=A0A9P9BNI4_9PEZI|nr:uncharacterized protein B0I36DRAFT_385724 [Microdochium trichocladiopsis]KAH7027773.1 hypothetical protein B0I36DRAFT_385724 [Microdochium trichocladiopsis]
MASAREDRMQSRMRGAGRHVVQDDSFGFVLPAAEDLSPDSRAAANLPAPSEKQDTLPPPPPAPATDVDSVLPDAPAAREGRMQSRLRGAGRHQVADDAFGLVLPVAAEEPPSESADTVLPDAPAAVRAGPNTSAKRRRLNGTNNNNNNNNNNPGALPSSSSSPRQPSSASRTSPRLRRVNNNAAVAVSGTAALTRGNNPLNSSATKALSQLSLQGHSAEETPGATAALAALSVQDGPAGNDDDVDEEMDLPPATKPARRPNGTKAAAALLRSSPSSDPTQRTEEVVGESPLDAPGSGRRQRVRQQLDQVASQSARLQRAVMEADARRTGDGAAAAGGFEPATSSPLARKTRKSTAGASQQQTNPRTGKTATTTTRARTAAQLSSSPGDGGIVDPLSSDPAPAGTPGAGAQSSSPSTRSQTRRTAAAGAIRGSSSRNRVQTASSQASGGEQSSPTLEAANNRARGQRQASAAAPNAAANTIATNLGPKGRRRPPVVPDFPEQVAKEGRKAAAAAAAGQHGEQEEEEDDDAAAKHVSDSEAAARLAKNRKRSRAETATAAAAAAVASSPSSPVRPSPELNSEPPDSARPAKRRRDVGNELREHKRKKTGSSHKDSPAKQAQPKPARTKAKAKKQDPNKPRRRRRSSGGGGANDGDDDDNADEAEAGNDVIPITVQRYTRPSAAALRRRRRESHQQQQQHIGGSGGGGGSDDDDDVLMLEGAEIPFADRSGVNAIDVLTQMCEEVIDATLEKMQQRAAAAAASTEDGAGGVSQTMRKEIRTKMRALEAFQEELRTRLLEHTIALDGLHSLRKRVRAAQREKLSLRSEILRIRAERQEVALKMDAVRIRHEQENAETLHQLALSSTMHDIELAVENGRSAAAAGGGANRDSDGSSSARMANLEINIGRMAEQACGGGGGGGNLRKIREFNAMLERAAAVLEGR